MTFNRFWALSISVALVGVVTTRAHAQDPAQAQASLRQVAAVLDYVASDYGGAVNAAGEVTSPDELAEQGALVRDAIGLAERAHLSANDPTLEALRTLRARIEAHDAPSAIEQLCRSARQALVSNHQLVLSPASSPNFTRAADLYREAGCATCHGERGDAQTDAASRLTPRPANFLDPERADTISPVRAYSAITFGVARTAMVRFDTMPSSDRWNLAFYVLSMRHTTADARDGEAIVTRMRGVPTDPIGLSDMSANAIRERWLSELSAADREKAVAFLQRAAPFDEPTDGGFAFARARLGEGLETYREGHHDDALQLFVSAYLDGVEPREAGLRAQNPRLANAIERAMMAVRESASTRASASEVANRVRAATALFDTAERSHASASSSFVGSMAIAVREGFEAALLIAALLGLVRKRGVPEHAKYIHFGWVMALPAGFITWLLVGRALSGLQRELAEGIISLLAAVVLLGVTHWIVGQVSSREFMGFLSKRVGGGLQSGGRRAAVAALGLAFVAAYREVFELVLFYQALLLDAREHTHMVWLGAAVGVAILVAVVFALRQIGQKIPPKPFMLVSSVLLALLAIMMVGKGVRALQEAVVVPATTLAFPEFPTIGFFATREGVLAQALLFVLLTTSALWPWLAARREARSKAAAE